MQPHPRVLGLCNTFHAFDSEKWANWRLALPVAFHKEPSFALTLACRWNDITQRCRLVVTRRTPPRRCRSLCKRLLLRIHDSLGCDLPPHRAERTVRHDLRSRPRCKLQDVVAPSVVLDPLEEVLGQPSLLELAATALTPDPQGIRSGPDVSSSPTWSEARVSSAGGVRIASDARTEDGMG